MMSPSQAPEPRYCGQTILITGASSGIGAAFARAFAREGAALVLVARRGDRLHALARELHERHGTRATVIPVDLSTATAASDLRGAVADAGLTVTGLINNAGFGTFGEFTTEDPDRFTQEMAVDVVAPVHLSHAFLPGIIASRGFLINVASMAAYVPTPRMAVYAASKAFVLSFTEALWAELRGTGVTVFALCPGATSTEFNAVVGTDAATAGARMRTPDDVVGTALAHLGRRDPGPSVIDGASNKWGATMPRLATRRATARMMHRLTDPARRVVSR